MNGFLPLTFYEKNLCEYMNINVSRELFFVAALGPMSGDLSRVSARQGALVFP